MQSFTGLIEYEIFFFDLKVIFIKRRTKNDYWMS